MAAYCDHIACVRHIESEQTGEIILEDTGRFWRAIQELPCPAAQTPQLVLFIGTHAKDTALKHIFPQNNISRRGVRGNINLRLDNDSSSHDTPLMFVDSSPFLKSSNERSHVLCHETISYPARWKSGQNRVIDIIYTKLLFPFSDVVCVFSDDFPSLEALVQQLMAWVEMGSIMAFLPKLRPRLLIVVSEDGPYAGEKYEELCRELQSCSPKLEHNFSVIRIFQLAGQYLSPMARHQRLQSEIRSQTQQMCHIRQHNHMLFSAFHMASLFAKAIKWISQSISEDFNFITASRIHNELSSDHFEHLQTFLGLAQQYKTEYNSVASLIASSIIMDAYPPRMHRFPIQHVFDLLYRDTCHKALTLSYNNLFARHLCGEIERSCHQHFERLNSEVISSSRLHWGNIRRLDRSLTLYKSNSTCLFCLRRVPEYHLTCGHCVCRDCILIFGVLHPGREERYRLHCIYDDRGELTVDLKPRTAGVRVIGIDGGGARGATSLELLKELQKLLLHCPLPEMVDIAGGSSSGGLIALAHFHLQWPVEKCSKTFESFAVRSFQRSKSLLGTIRAVIKYAVADAIYDETVIESLMKDAYGSSSVFFGENPHAVAGTRVAITAMTHGSQRVIFTNYNGSASIVRRDSGCLHTSHFQDSGYIAIRPKDVAKEPLLWEVARATSAAPLFFKPIQMSIGEFWDGALGFPNPIELTTWEASRLWPGTVVDVSISFGTGEEPKHSNSKNSLYRLLDAFNLLLDGQSEFLKRSTSDQALLRLNTRLPQPIRLDDAGSIPALRESVHLYQPAKESILAAATSLLVSSFFFTIARPAKYDSGIYYCEGSIHCRGDYYQVSSALAKLYSSRIEFITKTEVLARCELGQDICTVCHRYRRDINFTVRHPTDLITIYIRLVSGAMHKISGFPQSIAWFEKQQGLVNHFGTSDHDRPGEIRCLACARQSVLGGQKHKASTSFHLPVAKRPRR